MTEKEKRLREEFFKLMQENPDLPVVPMVDSDIVADDCGYWLGAWGHSEIGEYLIGEERVFFREDDDPSELERVLSDKFGYDAIEEWSDEEWKKAYAELPWIKAIIVYINLPDGEVQNG